MARRVWHLGTWPPNDSKTLLTPPPSNDTCAMILGIHKPAAIYQAVAQWDPCSRECDDTDTGPAVGDPVPQACVSRFQRCASRGLAKYCNCAMHGVVILLFQCCRHWLVIIQRTTHYGSRSIITLFFSRTQTNIQHSTLSPNRSIRWLLGK